MDLLLSQMVSAKFSHEMSGILGAVYNSVGYLNCPDESVRLKSIQLASHASKAAIARLRFFRELYGYSLPEEKIDFGQMQSVIEGFLADKRNVTVNFQIADDISLRLRSPNHIKLYLCLVTLCCEHIWDGGNISLQFSKFSVSAKVTANNMSDINSKRVDILTRGGREQDMSIHNVHEYYTYFLIRSLGMRAIVRRISGGICYLLDAIVHEQGFRICSKV
ncbi:histidine phosphotransferase family protein [Candidatus Sneabacter namystus]|uniref:Histidine phosphotransferase ChpT C-terminal domain-containing protein n=1 Tax=Candidatus Sneabacter namystus TaxID=2601646 RepID=A0A5C0UI85_9RICK|nr:histidine phosphotransferase family protein [Candidatus Sneabacter namystus]QEK39460.1 hypothetical protein FZC37_00695 [Candidatus Sneabacter namystus]